MAARRMGVWFQLFLCSKSAPSSTSCSQTCQNAHRSELTCGSRNDNLGRIRLHEMTNSHEMRLDIVYMGHIRLQMINAHAMRLDIVYMGGTTHPYTISC
eukprot:3794402-Pyramimonas_sp.AAC.2